MKNLIVFVLLIATGKVQAQNFLLPLQSDSMHFQFWDIKSGALEYESFLYQRYNSSEQVDSELAMENNFDLNQTSFYLSKNTYGSSGELLNYIWWSNPDSWNGPWDNYQKRDNEFDTQGRLSHYIEQVGNGFGWDNSTQQSFWFDDAARKDSSIQQQYDLANSAWVNVVKRTNLYNLIGSPFFSTYSPWNTALNIWTQSSDFAFTYYPDGKLKTRIYVYHTNGSPIDYDYSVETDSSIYNSIGKLDTVFSVTNYYPVGTPIQSLDTYEYDAVGNLHLKTTYKLENNSGIWNPTFRTLYEPPDGIYSSDASGVMQQGYDLSSHSWSSYGTSNTSFYAIGNNQVLAVDNAYWATPSGLLKLQYLDSTWYHISAVGTFSPENKSADCTFANAYTPGSPVICNADDISTPLQLRLTNLIGQPVAQARVMPGEAWMPPAGLGAGMYVLQVWQNGRRLGTRKMLLH